MRPQRSAVDKLRLLREWVAEFKHRFGLKIAVRCRIMDLSHQIDINGDYTHPHGMSGVRASGKRAWISLDPTTAWACKEGPYNVALHEFIHVILNSECHGTTWDAEEIAVRKLTSIYLKHEQLS